MTEQPINDFKIKKVLWDILKEYGFTKVGIYFEKKPQNISVWLYLYKSRFSKTYYLDMHARIDGIETGSYFDWHLEARADNLVSVVPTLEDALDLENNLNSLQRISALHEAIEKLQPVINNWLDEDWLINKGCEDFDPVTRSTVTFREAARNIIASRTK